REESLITRARAEWLGVELAAGVKNKLEHLSERASALGLSREQVAYMGDDVFDVDALRWAGWSFAPADAHDDVLKAVRVVTTKRGGEGAFREAADMLVRLGEV